jgi:hypothetical protein
VQAGIAGGDIGLNRQPNSRVFGHKDRVKLRSD